MELSLIVFELLVIDIDRVGIAIMLGYTTLVSAFTSSIFSAATEAVAEQFGVSAEVGILGLSL